MKMAELSQERQESVKILKKYKKTLKKLPSTFDKNL